MALKPQGNTGPAGQARATILARVRAATGGSTDAVQARAEWDAVPRTYRRHSEKTQADLLHLLTDRLCDYDAHVVQVPAAEVTDAIARMLQARGATRMLVPNGVHVQLPAGVEFVEDAGFSAAVLDTFGGILTEANVAIAETGTIVLQNVPGQGRRAATLVPDYHLCVIDAQDVVETVAEAMTRLQQTADLPTTFVSGPSATADIEMTRIKGVHGPRFLDVVISC